MIRVPEDRHHEVDQALEALIGKAIKLEGRRGLSPVTDRAFVEGFRGTVRRVIWSPRFNTWVLMVDTSAGYRWAPAWASPLAARIMRGES